MTDKRETVVLKYRIVPYYAMEVEGDPRFSGTRGIGDSPLRALINLRTQIVKFFPTKEFHLDESIVNPELASGWQIAKED